MTLSVIVPARNEEAALGETLRALLDAAAAVGPEHDIDILVVDSASTDGTARWPARSAFASSNPRCPEPPAHAISVRGTLTASCWSSSTPTPTSRPTPSPGCSPTTATVPTAA